MGQTVVKRLLLSANLVQDEYTSYIVRGALPPPGVQQVLQRRVRKHPTVLQIVRRSWWTLQSVHLTLITSNMLN